jgi:hypothetical protein
MLISESYILYNGVAFLNKHADTLIHVLKLVVGQVRPRGVVYIGLVLEALLRGFPVEGGMVLARGGILTTMLESCAANICQEKECEPDRVMVVYLTAMARILVASPHAINACFPMPSPSYNASFGPRQLVRLSDQKVSIHVIYFPHSNFAPIPCHLLISNLKGGNVSQFVSRPRR